MAAQRLSLKKLTSLLTAASLLALTVTPANAANLIRDAELEQTLRSYADPILSSAGISPKQVRIFILDDPSINAFVAGGMNIFINTGLILATEKPSMLLGVIAHETGHIAGAHLSQMDEKTDRATLGSVLGAVLGAAMIAGGAGEAGAGVIAGTQSMSLRSFLSDIRGNEEQADQAALKYLDANNLSASGMLELFELLRRQQGDKKVDPYLQTHPLTTSRIAFVRNHLARTPFTNDMVPKPYIARHARMLGRLRAYTWPPEQTLTYYKETDTSFAARYARAIATYRLGKMVEAIEMLEQLTRVEDERGDPYVYDTMAQIYYESGYPKNAAAFYQKALTTLPESALIQTDLARALIVINEPAYLPEAIKQLESAVRIDDGNADTWRLLATAYGKQNNNPMAYVALAQEAALKGETRNAIAYADYALQGLPEISAGTQLARDIKTSAERHLERKKEGRAY